MKNWSRKIVQCQLRAVLGERCGGPSLSYEEGRFIIYEWFASPVDDRILGEGTTIEEAIVDYWKRRQR